MAFILMIYSPDESYLKGRMGEITHKVIFTMGGCPLIKVLNVPRPYDLHQSFMRMFDDFLLGGCDNKHEPHINIMVNNNSWHGERT